MQWLHDIPCTWKTQCTGKRTNGQKKAKFEKWQLRQKLQQLEEIMKNGG
jgi:hypothetical protein